MFLKFLSLVFICTTLGWGKLSTAQNVSVFWSEWVESPCSTTCGNGTRLRTRTCLDGTFISKSNGCEGNEKETLQCNTGQECNNKPGWMWTEWTTWTCDHACTTGYASNRLRTCEPHKNRTILFKQLLQLNSSLYGCKGPHIDYHVKCGDFTCPHEDNDLPEDLHAKLRVHLNEMYYNFERKKGDNVLLPCDLESVDFLTAFKPISAISWLKNGQPLYIDLDRMIATLRILEIKNLSSMDNGVYACKVHFDKETSQMISIMAVSVHSPNLTVKVALAEPAYLSCNGMSLARVYPDTMQIWLHNGDVYSNASFAEDDLLKINNVEWRHTGVWTCLTYEPHHYRKWTTNVFNVEVYERLKATDCQPKYVIVLAVLVTLGLTVVAVVSFFKALKHKHKIPGFHKKEEEYEFDEVNSETPPDDEMNTNSNGNDIQVDIQVHGSKRIP